MDGLDTTAGRGANDRDTRDPRSLQEANGLWRTALSRDIVVKITDGKGRGAFWEPTGAKSGSSCKAGTLLFASEPLLQVVGIPYLVTHCSHCMLIIRGQPTACTGCNTLHYCSAKCQSSDARWHRELECGALRRWTQLDTAIRGKGREWFETQWVGPVEPGPTPTLAPRQCDAQKSVTDYAAPTRLVRAIGRALSAKRKRMIIECEGVSFDDLHGEPPFTRAALMSEDSQMKWSSTLIQLRQYLCVAEGLDVKHANAGDSTFTALLEQQYGLSPPEGLGVMLSKITQNCFTNEAQGISLYGLLSLVNNSCVPNCTVIEGPVDGRKVIFARRDIMPGDELTFSYSHLSSPTWIRQLHCSIEYGYSCACSVCVATKQTLETLKQINEVYNVEEVAASTRDVYAKEYKGSESIFVDARDALWCSHPDCEGRRPLPEPIQSSEAPPVLTICNTCSHLSVVPSDVTKYILCAPTLLEEYQDQPSRAGRTWEEAYTSFIFFATLAQPSVEGMATLLRQGRELLVRLGEDEERDERAYPILTLIEGIIRIALLELQGLQEGYVHPPGSLERLMALARACEYLDEHRAISLALGVDTFGDAHAACSPSLCFGKPFPPFPAGKQGRQELYISLIGQLKREVEVVQSSEGLRLLAAGAIEWRKAMTLDKAIAYLQEWLGVLQSTGWEREGTMPFITGA